MIVDKVTIYKMTVGRMSVDKILIVEMSKQND
jgi:hypothetical protein